MRRWAAVPDDDWPTDEQQRGVILADFARDTRYGDRRQEIVFIGAGMDEAAISKQLDGALLTDAEMAEYDKRYAHVRPWMSTVSTVTASAWHA